MIVKSTHRPHIYFLFKDNGIEVEFEYKKGMKNPKTLGIFNLTKNDLEYVKNYFETL